MNSRSESRSSSRMSLEDLVQMNGDTMAVMDEVPYQPMVYAVPKEWLESWMQLLANATKFQPTLYGKIALLATQKDIAAKNSVIMDGRDIGTVIFPDAEVKIFLTASPEARARRRTLELAEKGLNTPYEEVLRDIIARDKNDREREVAPAVAAEDAIILDNSELDLDGTVAEAIRIIRSRISEA